MYDTSIHIIWFWHRERLSKWQWLVRIETSFYNHPELLWERLFIPGRVDVIFPFCGDAVADCVVPLSRIPLAAAAAEATFAIFGSTPALLALAAKIELWGSCETEDDPEKIKKLIRGSGVIY